MSYISNLSITISSIVIFFYIGLAIIHSITNDDNKQKSGYIILFILWLLTNILQWLYLK